MVACIYALNQSLLESDVENLGTQADVAKAAGIGPMSLNRMEKNKYSVHPLRAKAVADVLGCKVEDLFEVAEKEVS